MRMVVSETNGQFIFKSETWAGQIIPFITENFEKVWKFLFIIKVNGPAPYYEAFIDDIVSVDFFSTHVEIGISYDSQIQLFPSAQINFDQLKFYINLLRSQGLTTTEWENVLEFRQDNDGIPPDVRINRSGVVDLPFNIELFNEASEKLGEKLSLTRANQPVSFASTPRFFARRRHKKRKRNIKAVNTTRKSSRLFVQTVLGLLNGEFRARTVKYTRSLQIVKDNANALVNIMQSHHPKYTLGDIFVQGEYFFVVIGGGLYKNRIFYDVYKNDGSLIRQFELDFDLRNALGRDEREDFDVSELTPLDLQDIFYAAQNAKTLMKAKLFNGGAYVADFPASTADTESERKEENNRSLNTAYWVNDQKKRADAAQKLGDINLSDALSGQSQKSVGQEEITRRAREWSALDPDSVCTICYGGFTEEDEDSEYPVQLRCGHWYHADCIKNYQKPRFVSNDVNDNFFKPVDSLMCPNCKQPALDTSFGDNIYRYTELRF